MPENNQQNQQPDQLSNGIGQNYQEPQANNENWWENMEKTCHFTIERDEQNPLRVIKRCGKKYRGSNLYCEEHQSQLPISQAENSENREMKCVFVVKRDQQNRVIERCYKSYQGNPNSMDSLFCEEHRAISRLVPKDPIIQAEKWWFKLKPQEREQLEKVRGKEATEKVWQEIKDRRSFWGHLLFIAFCVLVFFGWDNFWAWYEKPLTDEWGWPEDDEEEEDDEDEKEIKKQADTKEKKEPVEETPTPKTRWGKIKNWLLNNKTRTVLLLALIPSLLALVVRVVKLL